MRETTNILWLTPLSHVTCSIPLKDVLRALNKGIPSEEQHDAVQWKKLELEYTWTHNQQ